MKKISKIICILSCLALLASCGRTQPEGSQSALGMASPENTQEDTQENAPKAELTSALPQDTGRLEDYVANYAVVKDADPGLKITVLAPAGYSTDDVLAGMTLSNFSNPTLTDPDATDLIEPDRLIAEGGQGEFQISCADGFNKGNVYQIELTDDSITYEGEEDRVRLYNITIASEDHDSRKLNSDVQFLDSKELSERDAAVALGFDGLYQIDPESGMLSQSEGTGSFRYDEDAYRVGDVVAVYSGTQPDKRDIDDLEDEAAYVKIKGISPAGDGKADYIYETAGQEDVLFTPDVIPVHQEIRLQGNETGSITLDAGDLLFTSEGRFADMGLDENTHVEVGDFLAFYTGSEEDGEVTSYAEITDITHAEEDGKDQTTLQYRAVTLEEMLRSAEYYHATAFTEEQIRSAYDEEEVKKGVIEDLTNNGYLMENTYALAELALDTDEAKEYFGDVPVEDLTFYFGEDESQSLSGKDYLAMANGTQLNGVNIEGKTDVMITPNIVHFAGATGYGTGMRIEVNAKYEVTIKSDNVRAGLKVTPTFFFETEVLFSLTGDASTVWKWKWIFPYIYDVNVSGSVGTGIYVGVGFTTSAKLFDTTKVADEGEEVAGIEWPEKAEHTPGGETVMEIANYVKEKGKSHAEIFPPQTTGGGSLVQKYSAFCVGASKSWVDLIEKNIFDLNFGLDPLHITAARVKADFVVSAQLNAALGFGTNYERSIRTTFSCLLFHKESTGNGTEETDTSTFHADVYVFGALGIRAGIRLSIGIGLFDARLDSVGFEIEGGLYARFWGFFYAGTEITDVGRKNQKNDSFYEGGMLMETGAYLKVTFAAQMGDGAVAYKKILLEYEKPFFGVGTDSVISDFKYPNGENGFAVEFSEQNNKAKIPDAVFMMKAMSIKDGTENDVDRSGDPATDLYDISFDDPDFSYVYEDGNHYVRRNSDKGGEGTLKMTLKWRGSSFEQMSHDLERTIEIKWVSQMTSIKFLNKDGSLFFITAKPAGTKLSAADLPASDPEAYGYIFRGWLDSEGKTLDKLPEVMPSADTVFTSDWEGAPTSVVVQYYVPHGYDQYNMYNYELRESDIIDGIFVTEDKVDNIADILREHHLLRSESDFGGEGRTYADHYNLNETASVLSSDSVSYGGTTVFELWLRFNRYTVTFDNGDGTSTSQTCTIEDTIEFPAVTRPGYDFAGWADAEGNIVNISEPHLCTGDAVYTARWEKQPPTIKVKVQEKIQSWGAQYYWNTIKTQELTLDSYEITVQELIALVGMSDREFLPDSCAHKPEDVIQIAEDGSTAVILRFK